MRIFAAIAVVLILFSNEAIGQQAPVPVCWAAYRTVQGSEESEVTVYCGSPEQAAQAYDNDERGIAAAGGEGWPYYIQLVTLRGDNILHIDYQYSGIAQLLWWCPSGFNGLPQQYGFCAPDGNEDLNKNKTPRCEDTEGAYVGNPCNAGNGNKHAVESDYVGEILSFRRFYNSITDGEAPYGQRRAEWRSNYDHSISYISIPSVSTTAKLKRANGNIYYFAFSGGQYIPDSDVRGTLAQTSGGWTFTLPDGSKEFYDAVGRLIQILDRGNRSQNLTYDGSGRLQVVTDSFGRNLTFGYNSNGQLISVTGPDNQIIEYAYTNNNLIKVTYADGAAKHYHYEDIILPRHLTGISYQEPSGNPVRYSTYAYSYDYDYGGKVVSTEHAGGIERFNLQYDSDTQTTVSDAVNTAEVMSFSTNLGVKNLVSRTHQDGKSLSQTFDANNNLICRKDEEGRITTYIYNTANQKTSETVGLLGSCTSPITTSASRTTNYQYVSPTLDAPTVIQRPSVHIGSHAATTFSYSDSRFPTLPTSVAQSGFTPAGVAVGRAITLAYNAHGEVSSMDGPRTDVNDVTTFSYYSCTTGGACGQLRSIANALGHVTTFDTYDANGRLTQMTDPNGLRTSYSYDPRGRVRFITQAPPTGSARVTEYRYNSAGDTTFIGFPDGRTLTYIFDAARLLRRVTDNLGNYIAYDYDAKGNRTQEHTYDPANMLVRQIDTGYDIRNRVSSINAADSITQEIRDAIGNLTTAVDPKNNPPTQHAYDSLNRIMQTIDSLNGTTSYSYDVNDNLRQVRTPNNATTQYQYDDLGNLLQETSPDRGTIIYTVDAAGNIRTVRDARDIIVTRTYDVLNRLTGIDYPIDTDVELTYDNGSNCSSGAGKLCRVVDGSGTTQFGYDAFGNTTLQMKTESGVTYTTRYTFDAANRVVTIVYPDNRTVTYARDALGRVTGVGATVNGASQTIVSNRGYRADGSLFGQTYGNSLAEIFQYNLKGELLNQSIGSADTRVYGYDLNGNLTSLQSVPKTANYEYNVLDQLTHDQITVPTASTQNLTYDGSGNRRTKGTANYTYAVNTNRLTSIGNTNVTTDAAGGISANGNNAYSFDNAGHLITVRIGGTLRGTYSYNFLNQRTQKIAGTTTTIYHYDIFGNLILETSAAGETRVAYVYVDDVPIAHISRPGTTDTLRYVHTDHQGTPRLATSPARVVVWRWEGRAFGETGQTGSTQINLRFSGQYFDSESSLFYNHHRYYDPRIGRYITSDPIGLGGGLNTYAYVGNNPLTFIDPLGLMEIYRSDGVTFHSYPGPPAGGNEHARQGPGGNYHVHMRDRAGNEARISTETWKPLTPEDERIFNRSRSMQKACENLTDGQKKFFDKVNRQIFHRGGPTVNQLFRMGAMRGGAQGGNTRSNE